ncbi:hypothetical protein HJ070_25850, partial [Vibrio parahaemolyticus]|nr:hypothetical protein [Vibrio parahaemolyticus]
MQSDSNQLIAYVMTHHLKVVKSQADAMDWLRITCQRGERHPCQSQLAPFITMVNQMDMTMSNALPELKLTNANF